MSTVNKIGQVVVLSVLGACSDSQKEMTSEVPTAPTISYECDDPEVRAQYARDIEEVIETIPVCIHKIFANQGEVETNWSEDKERDLDYRLINDTNWAFEQVNHWTDTKFGKDIGIRLEKKDDTNIVVNEEWASIFTERRESEEILEIGDNMKLANNQSGCVNIYIMPYLESPLGGDVPLAYADFPGNLGTEGLVISDTTTGTLMHEWGHKLGLLHTHEREIYGNGLDKTEECYNNGDLLCDIAPDPGLSTQWGIGNGGCGVMLDDDANAYPVCYSPHEEFTEDLPINNRMSYYESSESKSFSIEQAERMRCMVDRHWKDIIVQ